MMLMTEFRDLKDSLDNLSDDPAFLPSAVFGPWFKKMETSEALKSAEEACLDDVQPALVSLREVVNNVFKNTCRLELAEAASCESLMAVTLEGDQVRLLTVLDTLDPGRFARYAIEAKWVQRFFRFSRACASLQHLRLTKERRSRQITEQFATLVSDVHRSKKLLMSHWIESCKPVIDALFPSNDSQSVMGLLASKGRSMGVKLDLHTVEEAFRYAEELCKQSQTDWIQDAQGLIGLLKKDVLPDLGSMTLHGILTPEFNEALKALEDQTLFTRSINGANILRAWSKHFHAINVDGCGTAFSDELLGSLDDVLKSAIADHLWEIRWDSCCADHLAGDPAGDHTKRKTGTNTKEEEEEEHKQQITKRERERERERERQVKNLAMRKKKAEDFKAKHANNAWGDGLNTALASLVEGKLPEIIAEEQTAGDS